MDWILLHQDGHQQLENGDKPSVPTKSISFDKITGCYLLDNQSNNTFSKIIHIFALAMGHSSSKVIFTFRILDKNLYTLLISILFTAGWESVVGIATRYGL
jgi:hypothetical protein